MSTQFAVTPIGVVHSPVNEAVDDAWGDVKSLIDLDQSRFEADCLAGLEDFSHVEIVFLFDRVPDSAIHFGARHPLDRTDWPKVGIFAQRAKDRPNRIGTTVCRLLAVDGLSIVVEGLDAIHGTPVLDIKPSMREFAPRGPVRQPEWATELMSRYWKTGGNFDRTRDST
jgi:tRNA-Thr(GGU) m(6)t(6)A37 methyltransferase TsaA